VSREITPEELEQYNVEETLGYLSTVFSILIKRKFNNLLKQGGFELSPEQFVVLATLHWNGAMSLSEMAKKTFKDNANVTRMVDLMEKKKLVARKKNEKDRRAVRLVLTDYGQQVFEQALSHVVELKSMYAQNLTEEHLVKLKEMLETMIENMFKAED
jgi:DNA-binding MarR family transcriptional regulator